jgi:uncharacterized protein (TIGR00661 family)
LSTRKKILVASLNWGLGHATRCIPVIKALEKNNFEPIIASDGAALVFLRKEFPHLNTIELPSYKIEYARKGKNLKWKLLSQVPKIYWAVFKEKKIVAQLIKDYSISGLISDNRFGVHSRKIPSVYLTHQLQVLSGKTSWLTSKIHLNYIKKFTQVWIPDVAHFPNLSGDLGHLKKPLKNSIYLGALSRMKKLEIVTEYDVMILLSGPEPQRTILEEILSKEFLSYNKKVLFVKGIVEETQKIEIINNVTFYNFMNTEMLALHLNKSALIICRSGYTSVMDLAVLGKKVFFIPTPGQFEQEYLAKKFKNESIAPSCKQEKFKLSKLEKIAVYKGFTSTVSNPNWDELFSLF